MTSAAAPALFTPFRLRDLEMRNRVLVSPMCQYSATDGVPDDWHLVHLGTFAVGGAGLVMTEASAVSPEGRISPHDAGIWSDAQAEAWARIVRFVHDRGAAAGVQLAHAGRKGSSLRPWEGQGYVPLADGGWTPLGPAGDPFPGLATPRAMTDDDLRAVVRDFADATVRAGDAGFDLVEVHAAHGYLLHSFLSPLTNTRADAYGGSFEGRTRLLLEVVDAVRAVWPEHKPVSVRISATDWVDGGWDGDDSVALATLLAERGVDVVDCSTGGAVPGAAIPVGPGYQVDFAERVRREAGVPSVAVGMLTDPEQAEHVVAGGRADAVMLARALLRDPRWPQHAAEALGADAYWPPQYLRARPRPVAG